MKTIKRIRIYTFFVLAVFLLVGSAIVNGATNEDLLPEKPLMEDRFKPGFGSPVGRIQAVDEKPWSCIRTKREHIGRESAYPYIKVISS